MYYVYHMFQAVESLRAVAEQHSPADLEAHFVPLVGLPRHIGSILFL